MIGTVDWVAVWQQGKPLLVWIGGMVLYAIFVFSFYERVSRRLMFVPEKLDFKNSKHPAFLRMWMRLTYALKYVFLAPLFLFMWFAILAGLLMIMKDSMPVEEGLLIGMSMLAAIRVCAYYKEELAEELAKTLPLAILAIFILNRTSVDITAFLDKMADTTTFIPTVVIYFAFTVVLEFILRIYDAIVNNE